MRRIFKSTPNILIIFVLSIILILPQLISKNIILGSDALFHFNRIYDTSQQIKHHNFQYFISMYGFQQSARIVTPLYSPLFSYFLGFILLYCGTWFKFQLVSNFTLFFVSGFAMNLFLSKLKLNKYLCLNLSIIYMTTYAIFYWVARQGYSSWGAAFLPIGMIPLIDLIQHKKFNLLQISCAMALMVQLHFISSIFLAILYFTAFIYCLLKTDNKIHLLLKLASSIALFIFLTLNIWLAMGQIYLTNTILPPFINPKIYQNTVTGSSWYWLINPFILPVIILLCLFVAIKSFKLLTTLNKYFLLSGLFFLFLSTNLFPWKTLSELNSTIVNTVQFPFRFFIPATICLLASFGLSLSEGLLPSITKKKISTTIITILCVIHATSLYSFTLSNWNKSSEFVIDGGRHLFIQSSDFKEVKSSFHSNDLNLALQLVEKSTPDYLPLYQQTEENKYELYEEYFFFNKQSFTKKVINHELVIEWENSQSAKEEIIVPVIKYAHTHLILNEKELTANDYTLTTIGNPVIQTKQKQNQLRVSYSPSKK